MPELVYLPEPTLLFGYDQAVEDPRDGLSLFGPLNAGKPYGIRAGAIGTRDGLRRFRGWVDTLRGPIFENPSSPAMPAFPGFEAVFGIPWQSPPTIEMEVPESELNRFCTWMTSISESIEPLMCTPRESSRPLDRKI